MGTYGTPFAESEALLAVMSEDEETAWAFLDESLPGERRRLIEHLNRLAAMAACYCSRCGQRVAKHTDLVSIGLSGDRPQICRPCNADEMAEEQVRRDARGPVAELVHRTVYLPDSGYLTVAINTGIDSGRLMDLRDRRVDATEDEVAALHRYLAENGGGRS